MTARKIKLLALPVLIATAGVSGAAGLGDHINIRYTGEVSELVRQLSGRLEVPYLNMVTGKDVDVSISQSENKTVRQALLAVNKQIAHKGLKLSLLGMESPFQMVVLHKQGYSPMMLLSNMLQDTKQPQSKPMKAAPVADKDTTQSSEAKADQPKEAIVPLPKTKLVEQKPAKVEEASVHQEQKDIVSHKATERTESMKEQNKEAVWSSEPCSRIFMRVHKHTILSDGRVASRSSSSKSRNCFNAND